MTKPENTYQVMQHEFDQLWETTQVTYPNISEDAQKQLLELALDWGTSQSTYWHQIFPNAKQFLSVYLPEAVQHNPFEKEEEICDS